MQLYAGCYERFLFGFDVTQGDEGGLAIEQVLSQPAHRNAVKCMDTCGSYLATGGADDQMHLFDMRKGSDLGFLVNPVQGPVPCLAFIRPEGAPQPSHMLSGSVEGALCIWNAAGNWEHIKAMKGHKGIVNAIAVHPTGSVALSVSRDKQMRLWDLTKGSCAYQAPLGAEADTVAFLSTGQQYVIATGTKVSLHSIQGETVAELPHDRRVLTCQPYGSHTLFTTCEGGALAAWDVRKVATPVAANAHAHGSRIRGLSRPFAVPGWAGDCIATASSDGMVKVWDVGQVLAGDAGALAEADAGARFTCLCSFGGVDGRHAAAPSGAAVHQQGALGAGAAKKKRKKETAAGKGLPGAEASNRAGEGPHASAEPVPRVAVKPGKKAATTGPFKEGATGKAPKGGQSGAAALVGGETQAAQSQGQASGKKKKKKKGTA